MSIVLTLGSRSCSSSS